MRAVDTNIVVRFVTGDDFNQAVRAKRVIAEGKCLREHNGVA